MTNYEVQRAMEYLAECVFAGRSQDVDISVVGLERTNSTNKFSVKIPTNDFYSWVNQKKKSLGNTKKQSITWHKINWDDKNTLPQKSGRYLCRVVVPVSYGRYMDSYRTLSYDYNNFSCTDMIITHWAEDFSKPEDV